jgi:hypothetical protein
MLVLINITAEKTFGIDLRKTPQQRRRTRRTRNLNPEYIFT